MFTYVYPSLLIFTYVYHGYLCIFTDMWPDFGKWGLLRIYDFELEHTKDEKVTLQKFILLYKHVL